MSYAGPTRGPRPGCIRVNENRVGDPVNYRVQVVMNFTEPRRLTNLNTRFTSIAFSLDGDRIAFACEKRRRCLVGIMNRDGSNLIEVAGKENARDDTYRDLHFSPDGTFLVGSVLEEDGEFSDVLLIDLATKAQTRLTHGRKAGHPALSPDGSCMVFEAWRRDGTDLWRLDREGGKEPWATATRLTHTQFVGTEDPEDQAPRNAYPSWSPDGAEIAFLSSALTDKANQPLQVGLIRPDGSDIRYLTRDRERNVERAGVASQWQGHRLHGTQGPWTGTGTEALEVSSRGTHNLPGRKGRSLPRNEPGCQ